MRTSYRLRLAIACAVFFSLAAHADDIRIVNANILTMDDDNPTASSLLIRGNRIEGNCQQMPKTAELIGRVPHVHTAWVSILSPRYHIPPHKGVTKGTRGIEGKFERTWSRVKATLRRVPSETARRSRSPKM